MKKLLVGVTAGALLLSAVGLVFAARGGSVVQSGETNSITVAVSNSGLNFQNGKGSQTMTTGSANSAAVSVTAGNVNVGSGKGDVTQGSTASSLTGAGSNSGLNGQLGGSSSGRHSSSQTMTTGHAGSFVGSATVSNISWN